MDIMLAHFKNKPNTYSINKRENEEIYRNNRERNIQAYSIQSN